MVIRLAAADQKDYRSFWRPHEPVAIRHGELCRNCASEYMLYIRGRHTSTGLGLEPSERVLVPKCLLRRLNRQGYPQVGTRGV